MPHEQTSEQVLKEAAELGAAMGASQLMSRRAFLGLAGMSLLAGDLITPDILWSNKNTRLSLLSGQDPLPSTEGWVVAPGYANENSKHMATILASRLTTNPPIAFYRYAEAGINTKEVAQPLTFFSKSVDNLNIYASSLGGLIVFAGLKHSDAPLKQVFLNCCPFDVDDARHSTVGRLAQYLPSDLIFKYANTLAADIHDDGLARAPVDVFRAFGEMDEGASPQLMNSEIKFINTRLDWRHYRGLIVPGVTEVIYTAPEKLSADDAVNNRTSYRKWEGFFHHYDVPVTYLPVSDMGHASTWFATEAATDWLNRGKEPDGSVQAAPKP